MRKLHKLTSTLRIVKLLYEKIEYAIKTKKMSSKAIVFKSAEFPSEGRRMVAMDKNMVLLQVVRVGKF